MGARSLIMVGYLFLNSINAAQLEKKLTFEVLDGIRLAHQLHAQRGGLFDQLPVDILAGDIIPQIHPRQTVDAWCSDDLVSVREIKVPYKIYKFDVRDDTLVCFVRGRHTDEGCYELLSINLVKGKYTVATYQYAPNRSIEIPSVVLRNNKIIVGDGLGLLYVHEKNLVVGNRTIVNIRNDYLRISASVTWHTILPLCISIDIENILRVFNLDLAKEVYTRALTNFPNKPLRNYYFTWHPTKEIFAFSYDNYFLVRNIATSQDFQQNNFEGKACFSYNGHKMCGKSGNIWGGDTLQELFFNEDGFVPGVKHPLMKGIKGSTLESFGDNYFLTRESVVGTFSLRALEGSAAQELTSLKGLHNKLYRLPDNHDYRIFVIDEVENPENKDEVRSIIKISVPRSHASMAHFCLFNAALKAEEEDKEVDWVLFKKADVDFLKQTAEYYSYFKKIMIEKGILSSGSIACI